MSERPKRGALHRSIAVAAIFGAVLATGEFAPASSAPPTVMLRKAHATSLAIATRAQPVAVQTSARLTNTPAVEADLSATADAPTDCDRCTSQAVTMQLTYADRAVAVRADNAAAAWSTKCVRCAGWALSLQVVVVRDAAQVRANNRALAVTAACRRCRAGAAAVQVVVGTPSPGRLTNKAVAEIRRLRAELLRKLKATTTASAPRVGGARHSSPPAADAATVAALDATARRIEEVTGADLHATSARYDVRVRD